MYWCVLKDSPIRLWSLSSKQRFERVLKSLGTFEFVDDVHAIPEGASVLILRGDFLFDIRVLQALKETEGVVFQVQVSGKAVPVAAHVDSSQISTVIQTIESGNIPQDMKLKILGLEDLTFSFSKQLRKSEPPYVLPISEGNRLDLEENLFSGSYKGITDLVTKFLWPTPAKWATRFCALRGISPNQVTSLSLLLVVAAGYLFWQGLFVWGLVLGWVMTFLDTVDGKLARVTITSSPWGNVFDHGIDLIHPPLWYLAWGLGLELYDPWLLKTSLLEAIVLIFGGYILGRLVEGAFHLWAAGFGVFCWKPFDSYFRLITARRNPNMIFLTGSVFLGRPDWGLELVMIWTVLSTFILLGRLVMAIVEKSTKGSITSWLATVDPVNGRDSLAVRLFTNPPATIK